MKLYAAIFVLFALTAFTGCDKLMPGQKELPQKTEPVSATSPNEQIKKIFSLVDMQNEMRNLNLQVHATLLSTDPEIDKSLQTVLIADPTLTTGMQIDDAAKRKEAIDNSIKIIDAKIKEFTEYKLTDDEKETSVRIVKKWAAVKTQLQNYFISLQFCMSDSAKVASTSSELLDSMKLIDDDISALMTKIRNAAK